MKPSHQLKLITYPDLVIWMESSPVSMIAVQSFLVLIFVFTVLDIVDKLN